MKVITIMHMYVQWEGAAVRSMDPHEKTSIPCRRDTLKLLKSKKRGGESWGFAFEKNAVGLPARNPPMTQNTDSTDADAQSAINATDWRQMEAESLSAAEYLRERLDVDPAEFDDRGALRAAVLAAREDDMDADTEESNIAVEAVGGSARTFGDSTEEIEALSSSMLTVSDWREAERTDTDPTAYVESEWGVDPREYRSEAALRKAIEEAKE